MSRSLDFPCRVTNGRIPSAVAERLAAPIRRMDGRRVVQSLREQTRKRSNPQNAYYWGVVVAEVTQMFRGEGNMVDADDVHAFLKQHVGQLSQVLVTPDGEVLRAPASTTRLSTQEFEIYMEKVRAWAAAFGLIIPLPNESEEA